MAPPTRRGLTSMMGVALRSAASSTSRPGRWAEASARASAWRRMRSARPFLPSFISFTTKRSVVRVRVGAYLALRGIWARRGIYLGLLAPYSERPCLRSRTPAASSVPRMMWYLTDGRSLTRAAAHEHDRVLLQVVADARDVGRDLHLVGQLARGRSCAAPSSASWASSCAPGDRRRASAGRPGWAPGAGAGCSSSCASRAP